MDLATPTAMILMVCAADSSRCYEMQSRDVFDTRAQCQAALPSMIEAHEASIGRCAYLGVDDIVTANIERTGSPQPERLATIRVTRTYGTRQTTQLDEVPAE